MQLPCVGSASNWQGQPQSQLQFPTSSPTIRQDGLPFELICTSYVARRRPGRPVPPSLFPDPCPGSRLPRDPTPGPAQLVVKLVGDDVVGADLDFAGVGARLGEALGGGGLER